MSQTNNNSNPPNVLFFSKNCKTCAIFMNIAQQNKILKFFQLIDVDDKIKELSNKGLKVVPTIIVKGLNKSIEGKNVFTWLESVISMNSNKRIDVSGDQYLPELNIQQNPNINSAANNNINNNVVKRNLITTPPIINTPSKNANINTNSKNSTQANIKIVNGVEIKNDNTPSVKSQPFGFLQDEMSGFSDTFAYLMTDDPLPKAFLPYDKDLQIYTAPEGEKPQPKYMDLLIKNIEMIRENDKKTFVKNMENEHSKIILNESKK